MDTERSYHHGDLRRALLDASLALIAETGPRGVTLREVARRAGVSHNAPYRHFRDKDALVDAVASEGFDKLTGRMRRAAARAADPLARFRQSGHGYVAFALASPEHYTVMFDVRESGHASAELTAASARAFDVLIDAVEECRAAGAIACESAMRGALYAWALVHGIAKLAITGRLPVRSRAAVLRFADSAFEQAYLGMAPRSEPPAGSSTAPPTAPAAGPARLSPARRIPPSPSPPCRR